MLADGQFALDGYVFGTARDEAIVLESGFDAGAGDVRDQDHPHPADDRMLFGRDLRTPGVFAFTIGCKRPRGARDVARELGRVWRGDAVRRTPGAVQELAWSLNGQERLVYGRGRRFVVEQGDRIDHDWVVVNADFQLASDAAYGTDENTITLGLVSTALGESGVVLPAVLPWETQLGAQDRKGIVTVATDQPTPFSVTVTGPLAGQASVGQVVAPPRRSRATDDALLARLRAHPRGTTVPKSFAILLWRRFGSLPAAYAAAGVAPPERRVTSDVLLARLRA